MIEAATVQNEIANGPTSLRHIYRWFVLLAALDVLFTSWILLFGGTESNGLAWFSFRTLGVPGLVLMKVACVTAVIAICQFVSRKRPRIGLHIARLAVALNTVPVAFGIACLWIFFANVML